MYLAGKAAAMNVTVTGEDDAKITEKSCESGAEPEVCKAFLDVLENADVTSKKVKVDPVV